ncbi:orotidine-5'-phosphate decarboxylase [Rubrivirga litoralis]|uniref:Orotidine 5'-phosphate decarboxylase n=1 Tax=Rubrivirga litoralis TaxID=3075598 RepID=A0ABU3BT26_9BACT|nr:orotidine-5'-phosphate decarboxylase [Rubrivirga sp. F394]MDT0632445.1 orotidine-5'-phosphate decarboxylase [Rubrivirga sp. F394]
MPSPHPAPFADRLAAAVAEVGSPLCVGLDPDPERLPAPFVVGGAEGAAAFCEAVVGATAPHAAAFKPNLAFFEAYGPDGWDALAAVCAAVRRAGRLLVLDGKRGDIGNTGRRYADALYDGLGADATTVAPYMGADSVAPFLEHPGRCAFVLVATSNPGGADLQALDVGGEPLYRRVARLAVEAVPDEDASRRGGAAGFVVGATRPALLAGLRDEHPGVPFLVPGVGAQGGAAAEVLDANAGGPILVNSSRAILYASPGADFAEAAADAAADLAGRLR